MPRGGEPDAIFGTQAGPALEVEPQPAALRALHCWNFCRGKVAQLPLYHAVHGLPDWDLTLALLNEIDDYAHGR